MIVAVDSKPGEGMSYPNAPAGRLQRRLRHPVRMSVGLTVQLAEHIADLAGRANKAPDSIVRGLVKEALRARGVQL